MTDWIDCIAPVIHTTGSPPRAPNTLCEICANACGGCCWSECGVQQPVPGWDAVRNDIRQKCGRAGRYIESYIVLDCPEFVLEEHRAAEYRLFNRKHAIKSIIERKGSKHGK